MKYIYILYLSYIELAIEKYDQNIKMSILLFKLSIKCLILYNWKIVIEIYHVVCMLICRHYANASKVFF